MMTTFEKIRERKTLNKLGTSTTIERVVDDVKNKFRNLNYDDQILNLKMLSQQGYIFNFRLQYIHYETHSTTINEVY